MHNIFKSINLLNMEASSVTNMEKLLAVYEDDIAICLEPNTEIFFR